MYSHPQFAQSSDEVLMLRQQAGRWLRTLRENAKLSQRDLAKAVGIEYYTFISQIEAGRGRVPPGQYMAFAHALNVPLRDFVKTLMRYYDPITHYALFEAEESSAPSDAESMNDNSSVTELAARIARLESLLEEKAGK